MILVSSREIAWYRRRLADGRAHGFIGEGDLSASAIATLLAGG